MIGSKCLDHEQSEDQGLRFVVGVHKLEHQVGDELVHQEVGEDLSKEKTVVCHSILEVCHNGVAMVKAIV